MRILVYEVHGFFGTKDCDVAHDSADVISVSGLKTENGIKVSFESETYHLADWSRRHGFSYVCHEIVLDLDLHRLRSWHPWEHKV